MTVPPPVSALTSVFLEEVDDRLPGRLTALLLHGSLCRNEFLPRQRRRLRRGVDEVPNGRDLELRRRAHDVTLERVASPTFDGFHATAADVAGPPDMSKYRPAFFEGVF